MNHVLVKVVGHARVTLLVVRVTLIGTNYTRLKMATEDQLKDAGRKLQDAVGDLMNQFDDIQSRYDLTDSEILEILNKEHGSDFADQYSEYIDLS
jgi:hypothetical protein